MDLKKIRSQFQKWDISKIEFPKIDFSSIKLPKVKMPPLKIGNLTAKIPIVQGGMGVGISLSGLASAVSRAGGIGVIAANAIGMIEPDYFKNGVKANKRALRKEIRKAKEKGDNGIIGVNIMVALNDYHEMMDVAIEEKADILFLGAGLPLRGIPLERIREAGVKIIPIVSSARAAKLIFGYWEKSYGTIPDGVVVEGPEAGGHLGFKYEQIEDPAFRLEKILPEVVETINEIGKRNGREIPVIAAGGIFTGNDIHKFLKLGASGVQMGTRFVATEECDADPGFKQNFVNAKKDDIMIIKSPVGMPGRAIKNKFINDVHSGIKKKFKCPWQCLESCEADKANYCISIALNNARKGNMIHGYAFAGSNAYRVNSVVPVNELIGELKSGYSNVIEQSSERIKSEFDLIKEKLIRLKDEYEEVIDQALNQLKNDYRNSINKKSEYLKIEIEKQKIKLASLKEEFLEGIGNLSLLHKEFLTATA